MGHDSFMTDGISRFLFECQIDDPRAHHDPDVLAAVEELLELRLTLGPEPDDVFTPRSSDRAVEDRLIRRLQQILQRYPSSSGRTCTSAVLLAAGDHRLPWPLRKVSHPHEVGQHMGRRQA